MKTKEEQLAYRRSYYQKNREHLLKKACAYQKAHRARINELRKRETSNHRKHSKEWRDANKARADRNSRSSYMRKRYGISIEQYESLLLNSGNACAICSQRPNGTRARSRLHVDHCHVTGKFRGMLCPNCNTALGMVKDNIKTLRLMIAYLERHQ